MMLHPARVKMKTWLKLPKEERKKIPEGDEFHKK
jgi:hypothetical protein